MASTKTSRRKSSSRSSGSSRSSSKKKSTRKYGPKASQEVETEMRHMKQGKHSRGNRKQAIAIGLSKARRKGAKVPPRPQSSGRRAA